jgi:hypothetical protein
MTVPPIMKAVRLHAPGIDGLRYETIETPPLRAGEVLVEVHAAAITRDELEWPLDRLPAVPSYELSCVVAIADDVAEASVGDQVYALTPFDRDGVAAEYAALPASLLAPKPASLSHVESDPAAGVQRLAGPPRPRPSRSRREAARPRSGRWCRSVRDAARAMAGRPRHRDSVTKRVTGCACAWSARSCRRPERTAR